MLICENVKSLVIYLCISVLRSLWRNCEMLKLADVICVVEESIYLCKQKAYG